MKKSITKSFLALFGLMLFANFAMAQTVLFQDDFESGNLDKWTIIDSDGDGNIWYASNSAIITPHSGSYYACSYSWNGATYYPDNWMISPNVTGAKSIQYYVYTNPYYADRYAIMASTTGNALEDFTVVFEEVPVAKKGAEGAMDTNTSKNTLTTWLERNVTLPEGTKYVAIRHYNSVGKNYLLVDDVVIMTGTTSDCPPVSNLTASKNADNTVKLNWTNPQQSQWPTDCDGDLHFTFFNGTNEIGTNNTDNLTSWTTPVLSEGNHSLAVMLSYFNSATQTLVCEAMKIYVDITITSIEDIEANLLFVEIYPNPAKDLLNINCDNEIKSIELYDALGRMLINQESNSNNTTINVSNFDNGIYILKIRTENGSGEYKVIVD